MPNDGPNGNTVPQIIVGSGGYTIEKLEGSKNYNNWKFIMKMSLIMDGLWNCILGTDNDISRDQRALAKICLNVHSSCYAHVRGADTSKDAWQNLQAAFEDKGLCRRLSLLRRLLRTKYEDFNSMDEYISGLVSLVHKLTDIGHKISDEEVAVLMLGGLPSEFDPLVMGLEATHEKLTSDMVKTRLLSEDYRRESTNASSRSEAAFAMKNANKGTSQKKEIVCYKCGKEGHIKPKCPQMKKEWKSKDWKTKEKKNDQKDSSKKTEDKLLLATSLIVGNFDRNSWFVDSGCTTHMSMRNDWFSKYSNNDTKEVLTANNQKLYSQGTGEVTVNLKNNQEKIISDVMYVPEIATNLLSVSKMAEKGLIIVFDDQKCRIYNKSECQIRGRSKVSATKVNGMYRLDQKDNTSIGTLEKSVAMTTIVSKNTWHRRLGHLSQKGMQILKEGLVTGMNFLEEDLKNCITCIQGKQKRNSFPKGKARRAKKRLELIHSDLCGPMSENTWGGARYLLTFTDDFSRKTFSYLIKSKKQVLTKFIEFKTLVENQLNLKIKKIRTDNGLEYCNRHFEDFLKIHGIIHETTVAYTPEQNGVSERLNRTLIEKTRCMLEDSGLSKKYWGEAIMAATYVKNRSPTVAVNGATPEEIWTESKIDISNLRVFGCKAYVHTPKELRKKLDAKSKEFIMVGYCEYTKGYRLADPEQSGKVIKARDVIFIEDKCKLSVLDTEQVADVNSLEHTMNEKVSSEEYSTKNQDSGEEDSSEYESLDNISNIPTDVEENEVTTEEDDEQAVRKTKRQIRKPIWTKDYIMSTITLDGNVFNEPQTFEEAISSADKEKWREAMKVEYKSLINKGVWKLVDRPKDCNIIKSKWVYKLKRDASGNIERFKARLVARGFSQIHGIDFDETFAPVVRHSTLRLLFAIGNKKDMDIDHLDVSTAFLNSDLKEQIYMEQPLGYSKDKNKVCLLKKSIYGLKQSGRAWNQSIHDTLVNIGYVQSKCEPCVYIKKNEKVLVLVAIYVDDLFVFSNSKIEKEKLISVLQEKYNIKPLGSVKNCLGMKVTRDRTNGTLSLNQTQYIKDLLAKFGMSDAKPVLTPMVSNVKLEKSQEGETKYPYQQLIGGLLYLAVCTRPDIAYAASLLSQFNTCHNESHWIAAKRVLRYLAGTIDYGLTYEKNEKDIEGFADSDWGGDITDRKSYTGLVMKFGNSAVTWESKKQKTIALSSTEAEYLSMCDATKEAIFLRNLLREIGNIGETIVIFNDNQSAQKIVKNCQHHNRTKHIDIKYHFIRDALNKGLIDVRYKPTDDMVADVLTKPLLCNKHSLYVKQLGLRNIH